MDLVSLDPVTAKLAVKLQLADISATLEGLYDDPPEGDELAAFQAMQENLQAILQILEGQVQALETIKNDHANRIAFEQLLEEERQASRDHDMARQLAGLGAARQTPAPEKQPEDIDVENNEPAACKPSFCQRSINSPKLRPAPTSIPTDKIDTFGSNSASSSKGKGKMETQEVYTTHTLCCCCVERHSL
jgi:hypothetical protein